jgi:hypothetical protein
LVNTIDFLSLIYLITLELVVGFFFGLFFGKWFFERKKKPLNGEIKFKIGPVSNRLIKK